MRLPPLSCAPALPAGDHHGERARDGRSATARSATSSSSRISTRRAMSCSAHRPAGLRRAFESAGHPHDRAHEPDLRVRTTTTTQRRIIRAGDLRTRFRTQYQTLVGYREGPLEARARPRWWTNYIVPDPTAVSWLPQALVHLLSADPQRPARSRSSRPPARSHRICSGSSRASSGFAGSPTTGTSLAPRRANIPRSLRAIDGRSNGGIARRATLVTAVNDPIAIGH